MFREDNKAQRQINNVVYGEGCSFGQKVLRLAHESSTLCSMNVRIN